MEMKFMLTNPFDDYNTIYDDINHSSHLVEELPRVQLCNISLVITLDFPPEMHLVQQRIR